MTNTTDSCVPTINSLFNRITRPFKVWRRKPYKQAVIRSYGDGILNSKQMHELLARLDAA